MIFFLPPIRLLQFFFSGTDKSSSKLWVYMVVVWSNKLEAELGETGWFF